MTMSETLKIRSSDGVNLHCEVTGDGHPLIFVHEYGGDCRSWRPQVAYFSSRYRCIAYNARGYPPSDVPEAFAAYTQERAWMDIRDVLRGLRVDRAHVVGLSMGGAAVMHFGLNCGEMASALVIAATGNGFDPADRASYWRGHDVGARRIADEGMAAFADIYANGATRLTFKRKDPEGWAEFKRMVAEHSAIGSINTALGILRVRPSGYEFEDQLGGVDVPALVLFGDRDEPCFAPGRFLAKSMPRAAMAVLPDTGHAANLEEPVLFNETLARFFTRVESGNWT
ncbi:MAG: alpha/beta hydrolase [Alphaproteobacteria bacterium]